MKKSGRIKRNKFALMSEDEILAYLRERYKKNGIKSLSYPAIKSEKGLYFQLYDRGLKQKDVIKKLGLTEEYTRYKTANFTKTVHGKVHRRWSWERVITEATPIVELHGFLPPAVWFQQNKMGSLVFTVYQQGKDWNDLRAHFSSYENSDFVASRNGIRWRSHPEASLSNFLYARGIEHKKGEKYPEEYAEFGDSLYGYYDLHFKAVDNRWIDVEIWGDKPKGHNEEGYGKKRLAKEKFNATNDAFLGIHYNDCYQENLLEQILQPYIGRIAPFIFDKKTDEITQTTHWSNADELIDSCKKIAQQQPDGIFPCEGWLRKRGKWKNREGEAYNTISIYIKTWVGGIKRLRDILGQSEYNTVIWTKEIAISAYKKWYEKYGFTCSQAKSKCRNLPDEERKEAINITHAVEIYAGGVKTVNKQLNIITFKKTKWSREKIIAEHKRLFAKYSLTPSQIKAASPEDKILFKIDANDIKLCVQIIDRTSAYFAGTKEAYQVAGINPINVQLLRKRSQKKQVSQRPKLSDKQF